ncbi:MAG: hypothetical protein OEY14_07325, partial [Myxococcales bacterium]|nr:hypothetical protein [Myxococcales bacterium]
LLSWPHPNDAPELWLDLPSGNEEEPWERASFRGAPYGMEAEQLEDAEDAEILIEIRREERDALRDTEAELLVIVGLGTEREHIERVPMTLDREARIKRYALAPDGTLREVPVE